LKSQIENNFKKLAIEIANLVQEKNTAYGDSFNKCAEFLTLLYPNGVEVKGYKNMLAIIRIFDKLMRIATDKDAFGEDPFRDIVGYGLLAIENRLPKPNKTTESSVVDEVCAMMINNCCRADLAEKLRHYECTEFSDTDKKLIFHCSDTHTERNYTYMLIDFFGGR